MLNRRKKRRIPSKWLIDWIGWSSAWFLLFLFVGASIAIAVGEVDIPTWKLLGIPLLGAICAELFPER